MSTYATNVARDGLSASHLLLLQAIPDGSRVYDVLEHLRDPWDVLAWAASTVRPGGVARLRQALANRRPELFALQFVLACRAK